MKTGSPPTPRKARTGELTPPGMCCCACRNSSAESCIGLLIEKRSKAPCGRFGIFCAEQAAHHRQKIRARFYQFGAVVGRDATDGDNRQMQAVAGFTQQL